MNRLFRISTAALMAISALGAASLPANAASCRDAHGRFVTCPGKVAATASKAHAAAKPAHAKKVAAAPAKSRTHTTRAMPASATTGTAAKTTAAHKS